MKKIISLLFCLICTVIVGCSVENPTSQSSKEASNNGELFEYTNLNNYNIGDEIPVYPSHQFCYKIDEDSTITITKFSVTLKEKNLISENEILSSPFYPFKIVLSVEGKIDGEIISNKKVEVFWMLDGAALYFETQPNQNGNFSFENEYALSAATISTIIFRK